MGNEIKKTNEETPTSETSEVGEKYSNPTEKKTPKRPPETSLII